MNRFLLAITLLVGYATLSIAQPAHYLQLNATGSAPTILNGSNSGGVYTLPDGGGTILTTGGGGPSLAWLTAGNVLTGGSSITPNEIFGSTNNYDVVFAANGAEKLRLISGGGITAATNLTIAGTLTVNTIGASASTTVLTTNAGTVESRSIASLAVTGSGTQNFITKWNNAGGTTIGNSALTDDGTTLSYSGTTVNLNTATTSSTGYKIAGSTILHNTGTSNLFMGVGAGGAIGTGSFNTATGAAALPANSTGNSNTATGAEALQANTSGSQNTATGVDALQSNSSGSGNSAVGYQALQNSNSGSNSAFGFQALINNTSGTNNTAIGYQANVASGALTNATAIGSGAIVSQSNSLVLGNGANVGIGIPNPGSQLANATGNITDQGGDGLNGNSITWKTNGGGFAVGIQNLDAAAVNPHGLLVRTTKTTNNTRVFVANSNGIDLFSVKGDGNVAVGTNGSTHKFEVGNGNTALVNNNNTADELRFYEPSGSGANYTAFKAQAQGSDITYTLPAADGSNLQALTTNGAGTLTWSNPSAGSLVLPFIQTANNAAQLFSLTNTTGAGGGAGTFVVNNAANTGIALFASSNGAGPSAAFVAQATGAGTALAGQVGATGTGIAGSFNNLNAANANPVVLVQNSGTGAAIRAANGNIVIANTDNAARELRFTEPSGSGSDFTSFKAQAQAAPVSYTLPVDGGTAGQVLSSSGGATPTLSWITPAAGGPSFSLTTKNANYTITNTDAFVQGDISAGSFTFTLPAANTFAAGQTVILKAIKDPTATNSITVATTGGELIDDAAVGVFFGNPINQGQAIRLYSDGASNWYSW